MWIVRIALNRPYTFVVLTLLILLISPLVIQRTPVDIFPNVNLPVHFHDATNSHRRELAGGLFRWNDRGKLLVKSPIVGIGFVTANNQRFFTVIIGQFIFVPVKYQTNLG